MCVLLVTLFTAAPSIFRPEQLQQTAVHHIKNAI